jgi:protein tyrosine phosphatase (PTP) superfamily phosphohydrolase (DUF442 family)
VKKPDPRPVPPQPTPFAPILDFDATTAENANWQARLRTPLQRVSAHLDAFFLDHGFVRALWKNRSAVSPGKVWRSNQPSPADLAWAKARGVKTVVTARSGVAFGAYPLEREACERLGLTFRVFAFGSRAAPEANLMAAAPAFFAEIEYPVLLHCKSGADRAGFLAALYLILREGADARTAAQAQLHWRYGHSRAAKTGILDHVFVHYERARAATGIGFAPWLQDGYDPAAITADFSPAPLADLFASRWTGHE